MNNKIEGILAKCYSEKIITEQDNKILLNTLRPIIEQKCNIIKSNKKDMNEKISFGLICITVFLVGVFLLFGDLIDYTDEILQFAILGVITAMLLAGINLVINSFKNNTINNNINLRGKLL